MANTTYCEPTWASRVTDTGGNYRIEGLLVDDYGTEIAWAVSNPQALVVGTSTMTLEFDGKMLYDQLPLARATKALKLVAVKIFSGNLSTATLQSQAPIAVTTPAYTRSQFEPSSPAAKLVCRTIRKMASAQWILTGSLWSKQHRTCLAQLVRMPGRPARLPRQRATDYGLAAGPVGLRWPGVALQ